MWPLKMTAREAEIQWRWFWMLLFRHSGQFWSFGAFFGHFWPFFSQFWPQTQTCRKLVMWPLKMIAREAEIQWRWFRMSLFRYSDHVWSFGAFFGHFWPLLATFCPKLKIVENWPCDHSKRSQEKQKSDGYGFKWHFYVSNILSFGPNFAKNGPKGPIKTWMSEIWNFTKLGVKICDMT